MLVSGKRIEIQVERKFLQCVSKWIHSLVLSHVCTQCMYTVWALYAESKGFWPIGPRPGMNISYFYAN